MTTKLIGAAAVIFNNQGQVLLVKHSYGKLNWELPGGLSESNESAEETAQREVFEETTLTATAERLVGVYYEEKKDMHHFVFHCRVENEHTLKADMNEVTECRYFNVDDLPRPISDFTILRIKDALDNSAIPRFSIIGDRMWYE